MKKDRNDKPVRDIWRELDFIRPGKPVDNWLIESFKGRLRDECLNTHLFWSKDNTREKLETWRLDYSFRRPYSALGGLTPDEYAASRCQEAECVL